MIEFLRRVTPQKVKNVKHYFMSRICHYYYGRPSHKLKIIGVTGTDGKTTTSNMIYEILKTSGKRVGLITSINAKIGDKTVPTGFHVTTPSPKQLQRFLKEMVDQGLEYVVLETTSHALDQYRVGGIEYAAAVYTNVTHEHIDYHKTYDNYLKTKSHLVRLLKDDGIIVLNRDDASYNKLLVFAQSSERRIIRYGFRKNADVRARDFGGNRKINHFEVHYRGKKTFDVRLKLLGGYNIYNALAAISVALEQGIDHEVIVNALEELQTLEGRWEVIREKPFRVVVDFAHTPNALENALDLARKQVDHDHNIIVVFGCAGQRDIAKRPLMGEVAGRLADRTVLTAEDPRGEDVSDINKQISVGLKKHDKRVNKEYFSISDRRSAIKKALELAKPGDIVLITGKGHEKSMNLDGKSEVPWSDQEVVCQLIADSK